MLIQNDCLISERMIKYYIQTGLIPAPEYTEVNQANYSRLIAVRLIRINSYKDVGMSFPKIKELFLKDDEYIKQIADKNGVNSDDKALIDEIASKEYMEYISSLSDKTKCFSRDELMKNSHCDELVFRLACDTGALEDKKEYSHNDMLILMCISEIFKSHLNEDKTDTIEKISDISKINNISAQLVNIYFKNGDKAWLYRMLCENLIEEKSRINENKTTADS